MNVETILPALDWTVLQQGLMLLLCITACIYCAVLNSRLKQLNSLRSGLGGSLVSLTDALVSLETTSKQARKDIHEEVEALTELLQKSEAAKIALEAKLIEAQSYANSVRAIEKRLQSRTLVELNATLAQSKLTVRALAALNQSQKRAIGPTRASAQPQLKSA